MTLIERYQKECQRARQKFKDTGSKYHEGYADAFDIAEQMYEEKMSKRFVCKTIGHKPFETWYGETTSCEWCEPKTIPLFYAECVRATIDDESQLISVSYCPNCGRRLRG